MSRQFGVPQPRSGAVMPPGYPPPPNMASFNYPPSREGMSQRTDRSSLANTADERPRSRTSSRKGERKEGFNATAGRPSSRSELRKQMRAEEQPVGMGSIFPLAHTPDQTYVSVVKSDIYQVQMRLETLVRSSLRSSGDRSARGSKRHSELESMKSATQDVETVTANIQDPMLLKLKLLEHLTGAMLQLEISLLRLTEGNSNRPFEGISSRPGSANSAVAPPSLSRLPSFLAVVDRLVEFNTRIEEGSTGGALSNSGGMGVGSAVDDMLEEIEDQVRMLEAELAMRPSSSTPSLMEKQGSSLQALLARLKRAGTSIEIVRERGIRFLQQESKEQKKTTKEIADVLDKARRDHAQQIKEFEKKLAEADKRAADAKGDKSGSNNEQVQALQQQVKEFQGAANAIGSAKKKDIEEMAREIATLKKKLAAEAKRRGDDAEQHLKGLQKAEVKSKSDNNSLRKQLSEKTSELNMKSTALKNRESDCDRLESEIARMKRELEKAAEVQEMENKKQKEEVKALKGQLAALKAAQGLTEAKDINTSLQKQVRELEEQLSKLTRSFGSLENYYKDHQKDQQTENKKLSIDLVGLRAELRKTKEQAAETEARHQEQLTQLNTTIHKNKDGDSASLIREVLVSEMRLMKAGFDKKVAALEQQNSQANIDASKQRRLIQEQMENTRKTDANIISALKLQIEGLKQRSS